MVSINEFAKNLDAVMFPISNFTNQLWAIVQIMIGAVAFFTEWSEGDDAVYPIGYDNIQILKYVNAAAFIVNGLYSFTVTGFTNMNTYILSEPFSFLILQDPFSGIIAAVVKVIVLSITITSVIVDPMIMLSNDYEITSLYTMDYVFTYTPTSMAGV